MCISQRVPNNEAKAFIDARKSEPSKGGGFSPVKWQEGFKELRMKKVGNGVKLLSAMADDEWVAGLMVAKHPDATKFTGGRMPDGEHGFHVLTLRPTSVREDRTILRMFYDVDSVLAVGEDSAGGITCKTVVATIVKVTEEDYAEALKGGVRRSPEAVASVKKLISKPTLDWGKVKIAYEELKKTSKVTRESFVKHLREHFSVSTNTARKYYTQIHLVSKMLPKVAKKSAKAAEALVKASRDSTKAVKGSKKPSKNLRKAEKIIKKGKKKAAVLKKKAVHKK